MTTKMQNKPTHEIVQLDIKSMNEKMFVNVPHIYIHKPLDPNIYKLEIQYQNTDPFWGSITVPFNAESLRRLALDLIKVKEISNSELQERYQEFKTALEHTRNRKGHKKYNIIKSGSLEISYMILNEETKSTVSGLIFTLYGDNGTGETVAELVAYEGCGYPEKVLNSLGVSLLKEID